MSARAAWRLESLGFAHVHDYPAGKKDWAANGLPRDGKLAAFPDVATAVRRDVPTCGLTNTIGEVRERAADCGICVVVNATNVVLGVLRQKALDMDDSVTAEAAMEAGPSTSRPNEPLAEIAMHLTQVGVERVLVTDSGGRLIGVLDRREAARITGAATD